VDTWVAISLDLWIKQIHVGPKRSIWWMLGQECRNIGQKESEPDFSEMDCCGVGARIKIKTKTN